MMGLAPAIRAPTTADRPTPPTPKMATPRSFDVGGIDDRAGTGHYRAANDGSDIGFDIWVYFDHILLIGNGVVSW